jgi:hypothetical protein
MCQPRYTLSLPSAYNLVGENHSQAGKLVTAYVQYSEINAKGDVYRIVQGATRKDLCDEQWME